MESKFLLPNRFKTIGWIILLPSFLMAILRLAHIEVDLKVPFFVIWNSEIFKPEVVFSIANVNVYNSIVAVFLLLGLLMVTFSKEKNEDEYISKIRLDSLIWSVFINYFLLLIALIFIYGNGFMNILIYNMFTILILFICRFYYVLYRNNREVQ